MKTIQIQTNNVSFEAQLNDTPTAQAIYDALPLSGTVNTWGDEIYFYFDVSCPLESGAREEVEIGNLGYWPSGPAFCVFFGKTPVSTSEKPRAASAVNIFGNTNTPPEKLRQVKSGDIIKVTTL